MTKVSFSLSCFTVPHTCEVLLSLLYYHVRLMLLMMLLMLPSKKKKDCHRWTTIILHHRIYKQYSACYNFNLTSFKNF